MRKKIFLLFLPSFLILSSQALSEMKSENASEMPFRAGVVSAHPLATDAGVSVLKRGGNAIDAAIAVQAVLNVVEPQASGIGGGCFLLYFDRSRGRVVAIDGREEAPQAAHPGMFLDASGRPIPFYPERITGGKAVGVPGCLKALRKAWERYGSGKIAWDTLFSEAIRLAEEGFPVSKKLAEAIEGEKNRLVLFPASRDIFFTESGIPRKEGDLFIQRDLGATLRLLARQGISIFYEGEIARDIIRAIREAPFSPGSMTLGDLKNYDAPLRQPVVGSYRGFDIYSMPPPSSGGVAILETLNILESFPLGRMKPASVRFVHLFSEAQKLAFADRDRYLADPDFSPVPVRDLVSKELASTKSLEIDPQSAMPGRAAASAVGSLGNTSTSHISIVDSYGNALAMTTTIEHIFGSAMVVPGRGFVLNNELTDFSAEPYLDAEKKVKAPNGVEGGWRRRGTSLDISNTKGGKRPLSSMCPTIVFKNGEPYALLGSPGGTQIIGIVLNVLIHLIDFGASAQEAVAAPRVINRNGPIEMEKGLYEESSLTAALQAKRHDLLSREPFGNAQVIVIRGGEKGGLARQNLAQVSAQPREVGGLEGASDPRGEGKAGGF